MVNGWYLWAVRKLLLKKINVFEILSSLRTIPYFGAKMFCDSLIKIVMITVMSIHSLLGCGIHAVHEQCCNHENREETATGESNHSKHESGCSHHHPHQHDVADSPSGTNPVQPNERQLPDHCQCNGSNCVFVHDAVKPSLIDSFSLQPTTVDFATFICLSQVSAPKISTFEQNSKMVHSIVLRCAMKQLWLI